MSDKKLLIVFHSQSGSTQQMADAVKEVQEPLLISGEFDKSRLEDCEELGLTMAAGLEAGIF